MTKKNIFLIAALLLLAALSLYLNRGRFQSDPIRIGSRSIPPRGRARQTPANPVVFLLDRQLRLTAIQVIPVSDIQANRYPHPIWELISDSNSVPVKDFVYGVNLRGMRPRVKGAVADPLQPGVPYRLLIEAGGLKAEHDFIPVRRTP